jgi:hypothetical protein
VAVDTFIPIRAGLSDIERAPRANHSMVDMFHVGRDGADLRNNLQGQMCQYSCVYRFQLRMSGGYEQLSGSFIHGSAILVDRPDRSSPRERVPHCAILRVPRDVPNPGKASN